MTERAAHLVDHVWPEVPVRQCRGPHCRRDPRPGASNRDRGVTPGVPGQAPAGVTSATTRSDHTQPIRGQLAFAIRLCHAPHQRLTMLETPPHEITTRLQEWSNGRAEER
jgi:hypothetical protein